MDVTSDKASEAEVEAEVVVAEEEGVGVVDMAVAVVEDLVAGVHMEGVAAATTVTSGAMVKVGVDTKVEMIDLTEVMITEEVEMCMVILVEVVAAAVAVAIEDLKAMIGMPKARAG